MKLLQPVREDIQIAIAHQFPELKAVRERERHSMGRVAISVFNHWLRNESEWPQLDCFEGPERAERDRKFLAHWAAIFDLTPVYTLRYRGRWPHKAKLVTKQYLARSGFLTQCKFDPKRAPSQFVVLPEFDCIYAASWDDTNVIFFNSRKNAEPIIALAQDLGLHCLEFDE